MLIPYLCLGIACILPNIWLGPYISACKAQGIQADPRAPRAHLGQLSGRAAYAWGAHQNALESLPVFIAGFFAAQVGGANPTHISALCVAWVIFRVLHGVFYLGGNQPARSGMFGLSLLCSLGLILLGALGPR